MKNIIAIDGFSACGKSTLAKALAKHLNYVHIDSGAMYRAATLHFLRSNIDINSSSEIKHGLLGLNIQMIPLNNTTRILLNQEDVSEEIRAMYVSEKVSYISSLKEVRDELMQQQRKTGEEQDIVMDGRDIGSVVFPNAHTKLFITASPQIRAQRRYLELKSKNQAVNLEDIVNNLQLRDHNDTTRKESPLVCPANAIVIDNSDMSETEQFNIALEIITRNRKQIA